MNPVKLPLQQRKLASLGRIGTNIANAQRASEARTAKYYEAVLAAYDKGDTVQIGKLHKEYKTSEHGVAAGLREQAAKHQEKWQATIAKILA